MSIAFVGGTDDMPVMLEYGAFLQTVLDFIIFAVVLFMAAARVNPRSPQGIARRSGNRLPAGRRE